MHPLPESLLSEVYFLDFESFCGDDFGCDALAEGLGLGGRLSVAIERFATECFSGGGLFASLADELIDAGMN